MADSVIRLDIGVPDAPPVARPDELELMAGLRQGREEAYERLITIYQQPVFNLVYRLLSDPSDTGDVVQEVFLKVFRNIHAFRGQSSLKTWIYRIALNEAHNRRRWFARHRRQEVELENEDDHSRSYQETLADTGSSPFDLTLSSEAYALLEEALAALSPAFREAVVLRDMEELSYEEIADVLNISLGTVKSRILRGREALRKELLGRLNRQPGLAHAFRPATVSGD